MDTNTILATGLVAILSALVGALVPGLLGVWADSRARTAARHEVISDLAGELLEGCERYLAADKDFPVMNSLAVIAEGFSAPRSDASRRRDDERARLMSLAVRISARHRKAGQSALKLVDAVLIQDDWNAASAKFIDDVSGIIRGA
ncbi:hypothetical protein [uncultured Brachybacterium sp.]|uniref:hypothetical protein n=1 Tax=uncultured Brachybacterium sp. TaxID=189680 RepID=UPI002628C1B7|nr:hypothetical protein [uncultured Brachybacterium sp.]